MESEVGSSNTQCLSTNDGITMKNRWLNAFQTVKVTQETTTHAMQKSTRENKEIVAEQLKENVHFFQDFLCKKVTICDVCSKIIRSNTQQCLKCKLCRISIHVECHNTNLRCQPKSQFLIKQKSASEIEARHFIREKLVASGTKRGSQEDNISSGEKVFYGSTSTLSSSQEITTLKSANLLRESSSGSLRLQQSGRKQFGSITPGLTDCGAKKMPIRQLNFSSSSAPSSPVNLRRSNNGRAMFEPKSKFDEDEIPKNFDFTSPLHGLHPPNLYVSLYSFKPRHYDELELKAGSRVVVLDSSDNNWWKGKCLDSIGVFPSTYVTRLWPGERVLQVLYSTQIHSIKGDGLIKLLQDQIVIQIGEDANVLIRTSDHRQGACPVQYLREI